MNIKNRDELLADIALGLKSCNRKCICHIDVYFFVAEESYAFTLPNALDILANDLYWDERGNWSEADRAEVRTF